MSKDKPTMTLVELYPNKTLPATEIDNVFITPTDEEIKSWIDSKQAVTKRELSIFIRGYYSGRNSPAMNKWLNYIYQTKNWLDIKKYTKEKIHNRNPHFDKIKDIYTKDPRLQNSGYKKGTKILNNIYNIPVTAGCYHHIHKQLKTLCSN